MTSKITVYEITPKESTGFIIQKKGLITDIYEKINKGIICIETNEELFKVNRSGSTIVPVLPGYRGNIVLSYDSSFIDGQNLKLQEYLNLTNKDKLNIQNIRKQTPEILLQLYRYHT
jgi:hypothetical protein